jgi:predicted nucleotidyltransferase
VQPKYRGPPDATAGLLAEAFGPRLHSGYLYGSVVRGNAVPERSDIDVIAVLLTAPTEEDRVRGDRVERALVERFPALSAPGSASPTSRRSAPRPSATAGRSSSGS